MNRLSKLEELPDEMLLEVFIRQAYPNVAGRDSSDRNALFPHRRVSKRLRDLIDHHVIGRVKSLLMITPKAWMNEASLILYTGLEELKLYANSFALGDASLSQLTRLKVLRLPTGSKITGECFPSLTALRRLELCTPTLALAESLHLLPDLESLSLSANNKVTDEHLFGFRALKELDLCDDTGLMGTCLKKMPSLSHIVLHGDSRITGLETATGLVSLELSYCHSFRDADLLKLAKTLKELTLKTNRHISGGVLRAMLSLESLMLRDERKLTDDDLAHLCQLKRLSLYMCERGFKACTFLPFLATTLYELDLGNSVPTDLSPLCHYEHLHSLYYSSDTLTQELALSIKANNEKVVAMLRESGCVIRDSLLQ